MMMATYIILGGVLLMALFAFVVSYREDHPRKPSK
jgi:hypothetical protein